VTTRRRYSAASFGAAAAVTLALAAGIVVAAGSLGAPRSTPAVPAALAAAPRDPVAAAQEHLARVPGDYVAWAGLGVAYVDRARLTADPSWYPKAAAALARSLRVRPRDNALALTGQAILAAAKHDFAGARRLALAARRIDPDDATTYGVLGDAEVELGRYGDAFATFQRMVDLRPGVPSYTRASYAWELRGDAPRAAAALAQARSAASAPADVAYTELYLGELAWNGGDLAAASRHYAAALRADPGYLPALAGQAKVHRARGETAPALAAYARVTSALPQPSYVTEYADLLTSLGRTREAAAQYDVVRAEQRLLRAQGVDVDLELALFEADHGSPRAALAAASAEWRRRRGVFVEDAYAWALHVAGRDAEALPHADAALRLGTRSASLHFHRGAIYLALGRKVAARADLRAALALNPYFSVLQAPVARAAS
jgi:tetratricopeptide (TPR) repeat protein